VKLVLDTSAIVAATRSDAGAARQLLLGALQARFELQLSVALGLEYEAVLKRPEQLGSFTRYEAANR
jgi:predicted nucleic acid-binding protein